MTENKNLVKSDQYLRLFSSRRQPPLLVYTPVRVVNADEKWDVRIMNAGEKRKLRWARVREGEKPSGSYHLLLKSNNMFCLCF